jgi:hypothetical protein
MPSGGGDLYVTVDASVDTTLTVSTKAGRQVFFNDDGGESWNPEIDESLRAGTYILELNPYSRGDEADFELTAELTR